MAKIKCASYIESINGRLGDAVFYRHGNRRYARVYVIPSNPRTPMQQRNRSIFAEAMASWKGLSPEEKNYYRRKTRRLNMNPHNLYISEYIKKRLTEPVAVTTDRGGSGKCPDTGIGYHTDSYHASSLSLRNCSEAAPLHLLDRSSTPPYHPADTGVYSMKT